MNRRGFFACVASAFAARFAAKALPYRVPFTPLPEELGVSIRFIRTWDPVRHIECNRIERVVTFPVKHWHDEVRVKIPVRYNVRAGAKWPSRST